jgi:hypothetical protein
MQVVTNSDLFSLNTRSTRYGLPGKGSQAYILSKSGILLQQNFNGFIRPTNDIHSTQETLLQPVKTIIINHTNSDSDTLNTNPTSNPIVSQKPDRHKSRIPTTNAVTSYMSWSKLKYIQLMP